MTKEEVKALIKAKIEGQGTNVDAGSVLPAILNGIIDLIEEGGGGTSDAVQYVPQELTEAQQMQARKNQDLYNTMTDVVTDDFAGEVYRIEVDPSTGQPFYGWAGPYAAPGYTNGFASAGISIPSGYRTVSKNGFTINGKEPVVSSGENWQMMVDPDNNEAILVETTAENVTVNTRFGNIVFEYPGLYVSAFLGIYNEGGYYGCTMDPLVNSFSENRTIASDVVSQIPYKYIPSQNIGSSADNQHFATAKNVYDYVRNNSGTGAVRYDVSQSLSYENQMRARRNQGLYYRQLSNAATVHPARVWDGNFVTSYYPMVEGDNFAYCLVSDGFFADPVASIVLSTGETYTMGTNLERRTVDNYSGSRGWFIVGENTPALALEIYASEEEPVTYNGMTFTYDGIYFLYNYEPEYFVTTLNVTGKEYLSYNPIPVSLMEHLMLEFKTTDFQNWTCNFTFSEAYHALIKGGPILASVMLPNVGTYYSTQVYYIPQKGIEVEFLGRRTSTKLAIFAIYFREDGAIDPNQYEIDITTQQQGE